MHFKNLQIPSFVMGHWVVTLLFLFAIFCGDLQRGNVVGARTNKDQGVFGKGKDGNMCSHVVM